MDGDRFDALARAAGTRRGLLRWAGGWAGLAGLGFVATSDAKRRRRHKRKGRKGNNPQNQQRQYPVFTTCYTADGVLGPIPGGPYASCQSLYDPDEFVPCNTSLTFADLKAKCDEAHPTSNGSSRILADPIVGLGDCPNFTECVVTVGPPQPLPGAPYASCWSWPDFKCETCTHEVPNYQGLKDLCGKTYPAGQAITCWDNLGRNDCYPIGCDVC